MLLEVKVQVIIVFKVLYIQFMFCNIHISSFYKQEEDNSVILYIIYIVPQSCLLNE